MDPSTATLPDPLSDMSSTSTVESTTVAHNNTAAITLNVEPPTHAPADEMVELSPSSSSSSVNDEDAAKPVERLQRPKLPSRKSSGTIIIPRESPKIEMREEEEEYDENDARTMSPRRSSEEIDRMGDSAREALIE